MTLVLGLGLKTEGFCLTPVEKPLAASIMGPTYPFLKARSSKLHPPHKRRHVQIPLGVGSGLREQGPYRLRSPFFNAF